LMSYAKTVFTTFHQCQYSTISATLQVSKLDSADLDHGAMAQSAMQEPYPLTLQIIWKTDLLICHGTSRGMCMET